VALALLSAEAGLWALGLLLSHVLVLETGSLRARLRGIAMPLAVGAAWAGVYFAFGYGVRHSSFYRDPSAPFAIISQGLLDLPIWFADLLGPGGFPFALLYPAGWVRLAALPIALGLLWLLLPALRSSRQCRFFALATLLCLAPLLACAQPTSRVLLGPSFGAFGWIACAIHSERVRGAGRERWGARVLLALHLGLAGLLFIPALLTMQSLSSGTQQLLRQLEPRADVVLVQAPVELLSNYALVITNLRERIASAPHTLQQLYGGASELWVERVDACTLELEVARGWGYVPIERVFATVQDMPRAGSEVRRATFRARVLSSTRDGRPQRVRFVFPTPLEAPTRQWLTWQGDHPVPWRPPRVGERVHIAPRPFFVALKP
jgi:hypothetical protein